MNTNSAMPVIAGQACRNEIDHIVRAIEAPHIRAASSHSALERSKVAASRRKTSGDHSMPRPSSIAAPITKAMAPPMPSTPNVGVNASAIMKAMPSRMSARLA